MKYKHIFFDLDHTLWDFDTNAKESLEELFTEFALQQQGIPDFAAFYDTYFKHNEILWDRLRKGYISRKDLRSKRMWHTLLDFQITDQALSDAMGDRYLEILPLKDRLLPGAVETLDDLKRKGYPLHLITNGFEATQHLKMQSAGIQHYFDEVVTSESAGRPKPHQQIFQYALDKTGCLAVDALMIGDALEIDVLGAQQAGMDSVYYNPAVPAYNGIRPTYTIGGLSELQHIL